MTAIFENRVWWTSTLKHRPFDGEMYPWWVIIRSDEYVRTGLRAPEAHHIISQWCEKNCCRRYIIGHTELVRFESEDDAILFKIAFSRVFVNDNE